MNRFGVGGEENQSHIIDIIKHGITKSYDKSELCRVFYYQTRKKKKYSLDFLLSNNFNTLTQEQKF